jgi:metal-responsive CopG/Arc/MetJ family transcriptional regulator
LLSLKRTQVRLAIIMEIAKKISISLPPDLLATVDGLVGKSRKRSKLIEDALRDFVAKKQPKILNQRDIEILNKNAEKLNEEALDTLEYQQVNW